MRFGYTFHYLINIVLVENVKQNIYVLLHTNWQCNKNRESCESMTVSTLSIL